MDDDASRDSAAPAARRGRPRLIDRTRIVAAARDIPPEQLTMQAVADALGVNRQSLSYHVTDRDELLRLVAVETVVERQAAPTGGSGWRDAAHDYAVSLRDAVAEVGVLSRYVRPQGEELVRFLAPAEQLIATLFDAGADEQLAVAAVNALNDLALASGRASAAADSAVRRAEADDVERALLESTELPLPALRRAAAAHAMLDPEQQFAFDLDVCIRGLATLLPPADPQ
jgi:TetR/AcrR family transcriptional regulator, tetracycline repressor protein